MARVKFDVNKASKGLRDTINKLSRDPKLETEVGQFLTERVRFEARRGKPLNDNRKFPELSDASKAIRARLQKLNRTARAYSAKKSNLTFTGQLQDAIAFKRTRKGLFELFVKATRRRPLRTGKGKFQSSPNNKRVDEQLRSGVESKQFGTRKFELFTAKGLKSDKKIPKRIKQIYLRFLRRQLR